MKINNLLKLVSFFNNELLWLYFIVIIVVFYVIISLLTWNIKKPLMFLGIPSVVVGIILMIIRFSVNLFPLGENLLAILNSAIEPLFINSIICILIGIIMIIIYGILNVTQKKKQMDQKLEI